MSESHTPTAPRTRVAGRATLDDLASFDAVIDVRSPAEFELDHVPGAWSCPVLDNEQRIEVGTLYKQVSPFVAKKLGASYVSANIARHLLDERFSQQERGWRPLVLCWRGGQRSGAMTTVLRAIGWDACQLEGGYKAFRRHVLERLEQLPAALSLRVVCGPTGSAKTRLLQAIREQGGAVLDLEGLAGHKGSVLGHLPDRPQPSQRWFETQLWQALERLPAGQPVFVEAESRKIGALHLPEALFVAMRAAPCVEIDTAREHRVEFLLQDYDYFVQQPQQLKARLEGLRVLVGHERVAAWLALIDQQRFAELTEALLQQHYDPLYYRSQQRNHPVPAQQRVVLGRVAEVELARAARELLAAAQAPGALA